MTDLGIWDFDKHGDNPTEMLTKLALHVASQAVDPALSQKAKNLHTRGVRKGAAKGREQMRKFLMKSIDNQADTINKLYSMYDDSVATRNRLQQDFDDLLFRKNTMQQAFNNVLADKMRILSIRKAFKVAVLNETGRLRSVHKQGA
jgi:predicted alpha/beta-fold hydrolase